MITLFAPAKINTFLAVGPPDARGWHPLRTIFQTISLYDEIEVIRGRQDETIFDDPSVPAVNTVSRALEMLRESGATFDPVRIRIKKSIPSEAGLGGGSSDAGTLLAWMRDEGWITEKQAVSVARRTGADVPFFLLGGRAKGEGYGERLTPLNDLPERWLVVAKPSVGISTPAAFRRLDASPRPFRAFPEGDELHNDFEIAMPKESRRLIESLLENGADDAGLTGSGSAVFGRFPSERAARAATIDAPFVAVAKTLPRPA